MKVLVTGANGFVGRWMGQALHAAGHHVVGAVGPAAGSRQPAVREPVVVAGCPLPVADVVPLDLRDARSVEAAVAGEWDAVVHLAGESSGAQSLRDPGAAWEVNAGGTARLVAALGAQVRGGRPTVLVVSTSEVYGASDRPVGESAPVEPRSPYAASKVGAELAARETARRTGLPVIVARPFPHTGPGQDTRFVVPAFVERLREARTGGRREVRVGNLEVTRDFLDVRDVAAAYLALLERGVAGETYNVASGRPVRLTALFAELARLVGVDAVPATDPALVRPSDAPMLVGDAAKLHNATGWTPSFTLEETLRDLVHAQAD